jgi:hypothetical protein
MIGITVDPNEFKTKVVAASLLCGLWLMLLALPLTLTGKLAAPPTGLLIFFAALFAYSLYTGIRALRKGWRSRLILRVVVPLSLLTLSGMGTGAWWLFLRDRS